MEWSEAGIVIGTRRHGETSVIVEAVTAGHGRHLGLVRGGLSRRLRPLLQPGNTLSLTLRPRQGARELVRRSRSPSLDGS
jgi:DNA repair protein RecO (recombination protein O)